MTMPRLTDGQIEAVRQIDLLSYLSAREPQELKRTGPNEYRTVTHGSLVITPDYWYWNRGGVGGPSALDYLIKIKGMAFMEAVRDILSTELMNEPIPIPISQKPRAAPKRAGLHLPPKERYGRNMVRYLQERGIHPDIIGKCVNAGILYEGRYHSESVCVFAGRDEGGRVRFAAMRGIDTDLKKDASESDKRYSFCFPPDVPGSRTLYVFEAPIDALSHATLGIVQGWERGGHRLSLGGTSHAALIPFLLRNPEISRVVLHMDSDRAGIANAHRIHSVLKSDSRFSHIHVSVNPAREGKDYNERLVRTLRKSHEATIQKVAASSKEEL
jgi:hypothetical protein